MPKKRSEKVETIKIEGLSPDTIREFAPKKDSGEEDKLWEEYFRGSPKVLGFPPKEVNIPLPSQEKKEDLHEHTAVTNVTAVTKVSSARLKKPRTTKEEFVTLDSTHTKSEQMIYSIMYRDTISKDKTEEYFSLRKLMKKTGIGSDKTVFNALKGLSNKLSIKMVEHSNNKPKGTLYKVFTPKEIFRLRNENGILIDINTKRIVTTTVAEAKKDTAVVSTAVTSVDDELSYISRSSINKGSSGKRAATLLNNNQPKHDDMVFDHKASIISLYKKYTGNQWRIEDDEFYEVVRDILLEVIEAAIISSILRSKAKINSFAYCEGVINEFKNNLVPGYLGYLREKWKETLEQGPERKEASKPSSKEHRRR